MDLLQDNIVDVTEQLKRDNYSLTWKEYASYLYNHDDMSFSKNNV